MLDKEKKETTDNVCYVTELTKCLLKAYLDRKSPKDESDETLRIFAAGDLIEEAFYQTLRKNKNIFIIATQFPAYYKEDEFEIHGRIDILTQHDSQHIVAHEVKSAKDHPWNGKPYENHQKQLQFYLGAIGLKIGEINYISKKAMVNGETNIDKKYEVEANPHEYDLLIERGRTLTKAFKTNIPPLAEPGWLCNYCSHECEARKK